MKRLLNYIIILSLSLVVFGCGELIIDVNSEEFDYIEKTGKGIMNYKGVPYSGTLVEYYKNGQLKRKATFKDGKLDGVSEYHHKNGHLDKDTYKEGKWIFKERFHKNGQLDYKGAFKEGEKDGVWEQYFENGQLKAKETYKDGNLDGIWEDYFENGQLKEKRTYKDGNRVN